MKLIRGYILVNNNYNTPFGFLLNGQLTSKKKKTIREKRGGET